MIGTKLLRIMFGKVDGLMSDFDGTGYLVLFGPEKYDALYDRIQYFKSLKSSIKYAFFLIIMLKSKLIQTIICP